MNALQVEQLITQTIGQIIETRTMRNGVIAAYAPEPHNFPGWFQTLAVRACGRDSTVCVGEADILLTPEEWDTLSVGIARTFDSVYV